MEKKSQESQLRIGIVGCANVAKKYAIKAFHSIDNAKVVSIASRDFGKAKEWAKQFGIQADKSYDSLLEREDIDAVYIPLPIGLHEEWVMRSADAGKSVMCEKSLSDNFDSVARMIDFCKSKGVVLYENFMCDFHPQHAKILSLISRGAIGNPFLFKGYFGFPQMDKNNFRYKKELGGGSLNDAGAYTVFMARKILSNEPIAISSKLVMDGKMGVDVSGSALLEFPEEKIALLGFSFEAVYQNNYSVWGTKGLLKTDRAYSIPPGMKPPIELVTNDGVQETVKHVEAPAANHFELIFRDFCDTVLHKDNSGKHIEGIYAKILSQAKTLEAMRISAKEKRRVEMKEIS